MKQRANKSAVKTKSTSPKVAARSPVKIILHVVGTIVAATAFAWLASYAGAAFGLSIDLTGWKQLAFAVVGALIGLTLGSWLAASIIGRLLNLNGTVLGALLGMVVGVLGLVAGMRFGTAPAAAIGVISLFTCVLVGYYVPWRK